MQRWLVLLLPSLTLKCKQTVHQVKLENQSNLENQNNLEYIARRRLTDFAGIHLTHASFFIRTLKYYDGFKDTLLSLRQFLATESLSKMMRNAFYCISKAL